MTNPFQDQFLKAGLVDKKRVNKVKQEQHKKRKELRRKPDDDPVAKTAELALLRQKEQSRQSNAQRDRVAREKEALSQIKQLAAGNRIEAGLGDVTFHFADTNKIKKMSLPKGIVDQLSNGLLGIVKVDDKYEIVPAVTAGKIRDRLPEALLFLNKGRDTDPDDPYAEFPIPEDFEW